MPQRSDAPPPYAMLSIVPIPLREANRFIERTHRHNGPVPGAKFCLGVADEATGVLRGVAIVGRPVSRMLQDGFTLEVTRCCTDGCRNACSMLYGAARKAAFVQGYRVLVTYTLQSEHMASLKASGWELVAEVDPAQGLGWRSRVGREDQEVSHLPKYRWESRSRSKRQHRVFPIILPWRQEEPRPAVLRPPETLIFTGRGGQLHIAQTVEMTARATTRQVGGFSAWDVAFGVEIELLKAQDCLLPVVNLPSLAQVDNALSQLARRRPEQLLSYGDGGYAWHR